MKRITIKCNNEIGYSYKEYSSESSIAITRKLGQYEDAEEEFEIDSIEDLRDRLTKYKFLANHEMSCVDASAYNLMLEDLNEYHKIEEELGIELSTVIKGAINGIWYNSNGTLYFERMDVSFSEKCFREYIDYCKSYSEFYFKDYGKTWALTKEELE